MSHLQFRLPPVGSAPRADRIPRCAFVSTNSITQGEQVAAVWKPLKERFGVEIDYAWKTFVWDSEATEKAHVHVVIVGFSVGADVSAACNHNTTNGALKNDCGAPRTSPPTEMELVISQTAQSILDARALYPDSSLADLYDPLTMPPELRKAHAANDAAVMKAYGFPPDLDEAGVVARLFELYAAMVEKAKE